MNEEVGNPVPEPRKEWTPSETLLDYAERVYNRKMFSDYPTFHDPAIPRVYYMTAEQLQALTGYFSQQQ